MQQKKGIRPNEELYGDFKLIPMDYDAAQQRVDFFNDKAQIMIKEGNYVVTILNQAIKDRDWWIDFRDKHCTRKENFMDKIVRVPYSFQRMIEIILSMRKPQVRFEISNMSYDRHITIQAQNMNGICFYSYSGSVSSDEKESLEELSRMPRHYFRETFI